MGNYYPLFFISLVLHWNTKRMSQWNIINLPYIIRYENWVLERDYYVTHHFQFGNNLFSNKKIWQKSLIFKCKEWKILWLHTIKKQSNSKHWNNLFAIYDLYNKWNIDKDRKLHNERKVIPYVITMTYRAYIISWIEWMGKYSQGNYPICCAYPLRKYHLMKKTFRP